MPGTIHIDSLERAVDAIAARLECAAPFDTIPVVAGSKRVEHWLRQRLIERCTIVSGLQFVPLEPALDGLIHQLLDPDAPPWFAWVPPASDPWATEILHGRILDRIRSDDTFRALREALAPLDGARAATITRDIATTVARYLRERPLDALDDARAESSITLDHFVPALCRALDVADDHSPAARRCRVLSRPAGPPAGVVAPVMLVGFTDFLPVERALLQVVADYATVASFELHATAPVRESADRFALHAAYGALREVEALRDMLLERLGADRQSPLWLSPNDVLVLTPDPEVYGPLITSVFARSFRPPPGAPHAGDAPPDLTSIPLVEAERSPDGDDADDDPATEPRSAFATGDAPGEDEDPDETADRAHASVGARVPAIPVYVAAPGVGSVLPAADVLLRVLDLAERRVDIAQIAAILGCRPVQRKFGFDPDEVYDTRELLRASGGRWAFDAEDRASEHNPHRHGNTLHFGLQRVALGRLLPAGHTAATPLAGPLVPVELGNRDHIDRAGRLAVALRAIQHWIRSFRKPATAEIWQQQIGEMLVALTQTTAAESWTLLETRRAMAEALAVPSTEPLRAAAVSRLLRDAFAHRTREGAPATSAVTVDALDLHTVVPTRLLVMIGMNDTSFPHGAVEPPWSPFVAPARFGDTPGEIADRRIRERRAFAQACAAGESVWIFWTGFEMRRGAELPPCTPVAELLHRLRVKPRHGLRHPWSEAPAWSDGATTWDPAFAASAPTLTDDEPLADPECPEEVDVEQLKRALLHPERAFLQVRLNVQEEELPKTLPIREPLELDGLERWKIRQRVLEARLGGENAEGAREAAYRHFAGAGTLPMEHGGRTLFHREAEQVEALLDRWDPQGRHVDPHPKFQCVIDGVTIKGASQRTLTDEAGTAVYASLTVSKSDDSKQQVQPWLNHLVATLSAATHPTPTPIATKLYGFNDDDVHIVDFSPLDAASAETALRAAVRAWRLVRGHPVDGSPAGQDVAQAIEAALQPMEKAKKKKKGGEA